MAYMADIWLITQLILAFWTLLPKVAFNAILRLIEWSYDSNW